MRLSRSLILACHIFLKPAIFYKNHIEYLRKSGETCRKNLVILHLSAVISEKVQRYHDFNNNLQHRSNRDMAQKLIVVKKVFPPKKPVNIISQRGIFDSTKRCKLRKGQNNMHKKN